MEQGGVIERSSDCNKGDVAREEGVAAGIAVNVVAIMEVEPELDVYYRDNVIGGSDAFMIAVRDLASFGDAIRRKLVTEVAGGGGGVPPHAGGPPRVWRGAERVRTASAARLRAGGPRPPPA